MPSDTVGKGWHKLPRELIYFLVTSGGMVVASLLCDMLRLAMGEYPAFPLLYPRPAQFDFFDYKERFLYRHSAVFYQQPGYPWYYPAPAIFIHYPFYVVHVIGHGAAGYWAYAATVILFSVLILWRFSLEMIRQGLEVRQAMLFACSFPCFAYPVYLGVQRGNIEAITWMIAAGGIWAYAKRHNGLAGMLIGLAGSIKLYPLIFLALFLKKKNTPYLILSLVIATAITVTALWYLDPNLLESSRYSFRGIQSWTHDYSQVFESEAWDHSVFGLVKNFTHNHHARYARELHVYYLIAAPSALLCYFLRVRLLPDVNQVLFLSVAAITLPPTSFDYTLCLLYIPLAWIAILSVRAGRNDWNIPKMSLILILLAIAVAPEAFLESHRFPGLPGAFKAGVLLLLLAASAVYPLADRSTWCPERHTA